MCGRFYLAARPAQFKKQFTDNVPALTPRYHIAPTQTTPIIVREGQGRGLHLARWGLVPSWSHDLSAGARMINARAETIEGKASYKQAFQSYRCLVPASGFYEWQQTGSKKQPYKIALPDGGLMAFAGLWDRWLSESGEPIETFTIITAEAEGVVSDVRDRMPVIIAPPDYDRWLNAPPADAKKLLMLYPTDLTLTPVSGRVNSVQNADARLLMPPYEALI